MLDRRSVMVYSIDTAIVPVGGIDHAYVSDYQYRLHRSAVLVTSYLGVVKMEIDMEHYHCRYCGRCLERGTGENLAINDVVPVIVCDWLCKERYEKQQGD